MTTPRITGVPQGKTTWNQFDEQGSLVSLQRLPEEDNVSYKRRIMDVFVHRANSSYRGLIYGITRELGLSLYQPLIINPKKGNDDSFLAPDPLIKFDGINVYLFSDYANDSLDWQIDRYAPGGNYEHLKRLVDLVNTTVYFEASLTDIDYSFKRSMVVLNQSNRIMVPSEGIPVSTSFRLAHQFIVPGSLVFIGTSTPSTEVDSIGDMNRHGTFWINYRKGIVKTYSQFGIGSSVRYQYTDYSFKPFASDVILNDINSDNFRSKLFQQVLQDNLTFADGLLTELGTDYVNELLSVYPLYFGV